METARTGPAGESLDNRILDVEVETKSTRGIARLSWVIAGLLVTVAVVTLVLKAWPLIHPKAVEQAPLNPACDLRQGPCTVAFSGGGAVMLAIEPREIPPMRPLRFAVTLRDLDSDAVELDFAGVDMNMGYNRVSLRADGTGSYLGEGMLPVCVRDRMRWEARVLIETPSGLMVAPFQFDTYRTGSAVSEPSLQDGH
jgi:hypothetical protein